MDQAVRTVIASIADEQWIEPVEGCGYEIAEAIHSMNHTKKVFRLIIKRELRKQENLFECGKYFHHAISTNWDEQEKDANEVLQWHNERQRTSTRN